MDEGVVVVVVNVDVAYLFDLRKFRCDSGLGKHTGSLASCGSHRQKLCAFALTPNCLGPKGNCHKNCVNLGANEGCWEIWKVEKYFFSVLFPPVNVISATEAKQIFCTEAKQIFCKARANT